MKRQIKFRAWDKRKKEIVTCSTGEISGGLLSDDFEMMQFTSLHDRNGKELFEGDIIEFDIKEWGGPGNIHVCSWDNEEGCWSFGGGGSWRGDLSWRTIIGNIYENPELLK